MKELIDKKEMRDAIKKVAPTKIAVAYIGQNSDAFIENFNSIEGIIVRPTLGTNPDEIEKIAELIGWDKIHLLTSLHAKIYLSDDSVLFGSCNLSHNGLGDYGLHEIAAYSDVPNTVAKISDYFDELVSLAKEEFPDEASKINIIERLKRKTPQVFNNSDVCLKNIPILWWDEPIITYNPAALDEIGVTNAEEFESIICHDAITITDQCEIRPGQFIIYWKINADGTANPKEIKWLYAHRVINDFVTHETYSRIIIQLQDVNTPLPPFKINDKFRAAFTDLMNNKPESFPLKNIQTNEWTVDSTIYDESRKFLSDLALKLQ